MTDPHPVRVALVTGAVGGIGQATVTRLRARGFAVIAEDISPKVNELGADDQIVPLQADVSLPETARRAVALARERFGRLDVLVSNAGLFLRKPTEECTDEDFDVLMAVNVRGAFTHARASLAALADTGGRS